MKVLNRNQFQRAYHETDIDKFEEPITNIPETNNLESIGNRQPVFDENLKMKVDGELKSFVIEGNKIKLED